MLVLLQELSIPEEFGLDRVVQCLLEARKYVQRLPGPPTLEATDRSIIPYSVGEEDLFVFISDVSPLL